MRPGRAFRLKSIKCPHCRGRLDEPFSIVIATRNCPHCGKRVVAEPEGNDGTPPYSREQLDAARAASMRAQSHICWVLLAAFLSTFVIPVVIAVFGDTIRDALPDFFVESSWLRPFVALAPFMVVCGIAYAILRYRLRDVAASDRRGAQVSALLRAHATDWQLP